MSCKNTNICTNKCYPEEPLKFIRFTRLCEDGCIGNVLKLCGCLQQIKFKEVTYLIGNSLTLTVPKYMWDNEKNLYEVGLPKLSDIMVENINGGSIPITIIESVCKDKYYVTIPITEDLFCECELLLNFTKFELCLTEIPSCNKKMKACKSDKKWQWIASVLEECCLEEKSEEKCSEDYHSEECCCP